MKKKIIAVLLILAMLMSFCGCSLQTAELAIIEYRTSWFSNLEASVSDFSQNWYTNLKVSAEDFNSYTLEDLKRETANVASLDFESVKVAYEDDFRDALEDSETQYITIQKSFEITADLTIPSGKTVLVDDSVILYVLKECNLTIESGGCIILNGISYLVLNELGTCTVASGGAISVGETASVIMMDEEALNEEEGAVISVSGMLQRGTAFYVYSEVALDLAIRSASEGCVINVLCDLGSLESYRIYDVNKAVTINGATFDESGEEQRVKLYGGFVVTGDNATISGFEIYTPTAGSTVKMPTTIESTYVQDAGITIASSGATIIDNLFYAENGIKNGIEIFPYDSDAGEQSFTITDNVFIGFGDLSDPTLAPVLVREYSTDVTGLFKEFGSSNFSISETDQTAIASNNTFEDCEIRMAILDCSNGEVVKSVFVAGADITEDYTFTGNFYITGDWNVTGANLTATSGAVLTIGASVNFYMDETSSMTIADDASVVLQSKSVFETYGAVTGSVTGAGSFVDWPNYIEFTIMLENDDAWEQDIVIGEYVGYDVGSLELVYRMKKVSAGASYFAGYTFEFSLSEGGSVLSDSYIFTGDTVLYVQFTGVSLPIYYDDNGGSDIGDNRSEITYPRTEYLDNATTRKETEFFAGWKIVGGTFDGEYITVITEEFMLDLLNAGYTSLSLQAQWIETNNLSGYSYIYYLNSGYQIDDYCDVYVYTPAGSDSLTYDIDDYSYSDGEIGLVEVADGSSYNDQAYIFFDIESGYEIKSVTIIENPSTTGGTYYDMTNEAIVCYDAGEPLVFDSTRTLSIEVTTQKITTEEAVIDYVGLNSTNSLAIVTALDGYTFDIGDTIKFSARTEKNAIVSHFYVVAYWTDDDGDTDIVTYYTPTAIEVDDDYEGGKVVFKIYSIDGRSCFADDFAFDYEFAINEEE
ncbi:MAG: hypothetical protein R3Y65_01335 [Bacillota bacterium]